MQAASLLRAFGSIAAVSAAPPQVLSHVLGQDGYLAMPFFVSRRLHEAAMRERVTRAPVLSDEKALFEWLIGRFAGLEAEELIVIYADRNGGFLCEETFRSGSQECVSVEPRLLFRQAARLDCGSILLAHNHPSGRAFPSALDIAATHRIIVSARLLEVDLLDHLIIAGSSVTSMRKSGLL